MTDRLLPDQPGGPAPLLSTVVGDQVTEIVVKKSRFITRLSHVDSVEQADQVITAVRKEFWDARHHCVALIVGPHGDQQRSSDDGEPSSTAGAPMLEVLRHQGITDVVTVVTRYFGGTLLGTGGLVRAYSQSVTKALDAAQIVRRVPMLNVDVVVEHAAAGRIENLLREWALTHGASFGVPKYDFQVSLTILVPPDQLDALDQALAAETAGTIRPVATGWTVAEIPAARYQDQPREQSSSS